MLIGRGETAVFAKNLYHWCWDRYSKEGGGWQIFVNLLRRHWWYVCRILKIDLPDYPHFGS